MIVVLSGVAGSGKTKIGDGVAARLHAPFLDADSLHAPDALEQMGRGEPLTAAQRDAWMDRVIAAVRGRESLVLACSLLRRAHRDELRAVGGVRIFLLSVPRAELERRLRERHGHFFPARLLQDQLDTLEPPPPDEPVTVIDANHPAAEVVDAIVATLDDPPA